MLALMPRGGPTPQASRGQAKPRLKLWHSRRPMHLLISLPSRSRPRAGNPSEWERPCAD